MERSKDTTKYKSCHSRSNYKTIMMLLVVVVVIFVSYENLQKDLTKKLNILQLSPNGDYPSHAISKRKGLAAKTWQNSSMIRICSQEERKRYVNYKCKKLGKPPSKSKKIRFLVDYRRKLAFSMINKCGTSTIRRIMTNVANKDEIIKKVQIRNKQHLRRLKMDEVSFKPMEANTKLRGFTKFLVVRNPMSRALSTYMNKFVNEEFANHPYKIGPGEYLKYYLKETKQKFEYPLPTFQTLLKFISSNSYWATFDKHLESMFRISNPCYVQYDFVLKLETLAHDLPLFIEQTYGKNFTHLQEIRENAVEYNSIENKSHELKNRSVPETKYLDEYWKVDKDIIQRVMNTYKYDTLIYGYQYDIATSIATCKYPGLDCC